MELAGASYFYALAALSMAFVGFTSIVVVLHQGTGKPLSPFQVLITRLFAELGLMATAFAMLAPTLAIGGLRESLVWQISSAIMLAVLVPWLVTYPKRRKAAAPGQKFPLRGHIMNSLGALAVLALCLNLVGSPINPSPAPLAMATVYVLSYASVSFFWTYASFLRD
jgi:hydrogenase-4 membrane subunit HyfE